MTGSLEQIDARTLAWILGVLAVLAALVWLYRLYRRYSMRRALLNALKGVAYDVVRDVLVPDGMEGHLHIDFLLLTQRGILILDLREIPGMVFGGDQMDQWTVITRRRRYTFVNPQGALLDRIAAVKLIAGEVPVEGRVLFTTRSRFPKGRPRSALILDSIKAEYAPVDKGAMQDTVRLFEPAWERLKASTRPSDLARR
ncbi:MAG TPA: nuclease-related domain-containing protein [Steroidobacteraceae bacterium]|nr:nuclease-related domain-containing protein [Steroidobacteraceae bacterium]